MPNRATLPTGYISKKRALRIVVPVSAYMLEKWSQSQRRFNKPNGIKRPHRNLFLGRLIRTRSVCVDGRLHTAYHEADLRTTKAAYKAVKNGSRYGGTDTRPTVTPAAAVRKFGFSLTTIDAWHAFCPYLESGKLTRVWDERGKLKGTSFRRVNGQQPKRVPTAKRRTLYLDELEEIDRNKRNGIRLHEWNGSFADGRVTLDVAAENSGFSVKMLRHWTQDGKCPYHSDRKLPSEKQFPPEPFKSPSGQPLHSVLMDDVDTIRRSKDEAERLGKRGMVDSQELGEMMGVEKLEHLHLLREILSDGRDSGELVEGTDWLRPVVRIQIRNGWTGRPFLYNPEAARRYVLSYTAAEANTAEGPADPTLQPLADVVRAASGRPDKHERDETLLSWYEDTTAETYRSPAKCRDRWNIENADDQFRKNVADPLSAVKKAINRAKSRRKQGKK